MPDRDAGRPEHRPHRGLSTFARVNEFGFIESPYRKVVNGKVTGEIVYMAADEEENYVVAQANTPINPDGTFKDDRVLVRRSPQAASLDDLRKMLEAESFFGATTDIGYVPPRRSTTWTFARSRSSRSARR